MSGTIKVIFNSLGALLLGGSIAFSTLTGIELKKTKLELNNLQEINISSKTENENLRKSLAEEIAKKEEYRNNLQLMQTALNTANSRLNTLTNEITEKDLAINSLQEEIMKIKNKGVSYTLENYVQAMHILIADFYDETEAGLRIEELKIKYENGEELYKGIDFNFMEQGQDFHAQYYGDELFVEYFLTNRVGGVDFPAGKTYLEFLNTMYQIKNINILEDLNYIVGQKYALLETPAYLESLDYECIEKTDNYVKLQNKLMLSSGDLFTNVNEDEIYNYIELTKNGDEITIKSFVMDYYDNDGTIHYRTSTNAVVPYSIKINKLQEELNFALSEKTELETEVTTLIEQVIALEHTVLIYEEQIEQLREQIRVLQSQLGITSASQFTFSGNILTGYVGEDTEIVVPTSYSIGEPLLQEETYNSFTELREKCAPFSEEDIFPFDITLNTGEVVTITHEMELYDHQSQLSFPTTIVRKITTYVDGTDYQVTAIGNNAFYQSNITSIEIPEGITQIGSYAFSNCESLNNVKLPNTLEKILSQGFLRCYTLETIEIPSNVKELGISAFAVCTSLKSIIIPEGITTLQSSLFSNCTSLKSIVIPAGISTIPLSFVKECTSLESIYIPASVTSIDAFAFTNCTSLKNVYYEGTEEQWNAIEINAEISSWAGDNNALLNATKHFNYVLEQ